ncbi:MAG: glycoside hydrolase family 3 [Micromonosporaceae bacterium]|nr:glycoside hydrolase family 3 [Micromonosporaceae bacterium]
MPRRPRTVAASVAILALGVLAACTSPPPATPEPEPTTPSVTPTGTSPAEIAAAIAAGMSPEELVGQVLMPDVTMPADISAAVTEVQQYGLGGVIIMGSATAAEVRNLTGALQSAAPTVDGRRLPLLISVDQEYGFVRRISDLVQLPAAMAFGAANRPDLTEAAWAAVGQELAAIGVNVDNAPVADVIGPAGNAVIGSRSYGGDANIVAGQVGAVVAGLNSAGVAAVVKHFPGHGNTTVDSHTDLPVLTQSREELEARDLAPFRAGIAAGAQLVMVGHLDVRSIDPGVPATFSSKVLVDLLRGELGFTGVVVSDALNMAGATRESVGEQAIQAILAGNDLLLMPPSVPDARAGLLDALQSGRLSRQRLEESVTRILTLKLSLTERQRPDMSVVNSAAHQAAAAAVTAAGITVLSGPCSGPLVPGPVQITTSAGRAQQATWLTEALVAAGVSVVPSGGNRIHLVGYGDDPSDLASGAAATVAMDTPYLLAAADSPVKVATYANTRAAVEALAAVIAGGAAAPGRSPVPVPGLPPSACAA